MSKCITPLTAAALVAGMFATATAQQQGVYDPPTGGVTGAVVAGQSGDLNQTIAACLALGNEEQVALAKFAEGRAKHDDVKKFVAKMKQDHQAAVEKLQGLAPIATLGSLRDSDDDDASFEHQVAHAGTAGGQSQMIALQRRIAEECLALTRQELKDKEGADFDRCFIGQQVGAHVAMLAKLKASREFATGEVQQFIDEAIQTVEEHHKQAKQLAEKLEKQWKEKVRSDS